MTSRTAIALIAKAPVAGAVKTRFVPPCTYEEAAQFATAFLLDTSASAHNVPDADVWCAHLGDPQILRDLLPSGTHMVEQRGGDFDERLAYVADDLFKEGYEQVVLLGADCPTVDAAHLSAAVHALSDNDVVIGPANDGGYVLLALKQPEHRLFVGIEMGTETVFAETVERANECELNLETLPVLHDLDTIEELRSAADSGQLDHATRTRALLSSASW